MERRSEHGPGALSGYRILDLCDAPGVLCTKILADLGADVIKVEPPAGNATRYRGPFYQEQTDPEKSLFFWYFHANKRSVTLDLATATGQALLHRLLATADALVETFPPGYLDGLGLSFRHLRALYPRLVMTSITGFGSTGPYSHYQAPDIVGLAMGGLAYLCGEPDGPPAPPGGLQGYHLAALNGAVGTLIALWHREATGQGQHVDVSMQAAVANTLETTHQTYDFNREIRTRCGHRREGAAYILPCQDGYVALLCAGQLGWRRLIAWLTAEGAVGALADERLVDDVYRFEHDAEVHTALQAFFATKTKQQAYTEAQHYRVPLAPVQTARDLVESPQLQARQFFVDIEHPELGTTLRYPGAPYALSVTPWQLRRRPPRLGEHNAEIFASLPPLPALTPTLAGDILESAQHNRPALQGIRVLDFSWFGAAPLGTKILADHGAEVIRVESMARPDLLRLMGSSHFRDYTPDINGSGFFNDFNSSKYGITLNLNHPEGVAIAQRLVALSDVVIDSFTRRAMRKWGLYYDDLVQLKPDIIVVSAAQQGHTGPHADYLGFGYNLQALAGINHLTGYPDGYPLGTSVNYPDFVLPMFVASVIMSALLYRRRTGQDSTLTCRSTRPRPRPWGPCSWTTWSMAASPPVRVVAPPLRRPMECIAARATIAGVSSPSVLRMSGERYVTLWAIQTGPRRRVSRRWRAGYSTSRRWMRCCTPGPCSMRLNTSCTCCRTLGWRPAWCKTLPTCSNTIRNYGTVGIIISCSIRSPVPRSIWDRPSSSLPPRPRCGQPRVLASTTPTSTGNC